MTKKILILIIVSTLQSALPMSLTNEIRQKALRNTGALKTPPILDYAANKMYSKGFYELNLLETESIVQILNFVLIFQNDNFQNLMRHTFFDLAEELITFDMHKLGLNSKPVSTDLLKYLKLHDSNQNNETTLLFDYSVQKFTKIVSEEITCSSIDIDYYIQLINKIREDIRETQETDFDFEDGDQTMFCNIL